MWLYFTILVATLGFWFVFYKLVNKPKKDMSVNDDIMTSDEDSVKDHPLYNSLENFTTTNAYSDVPYGFRKEFTPNLQGSSRNTGYHNPNVSRSPAIYNSLSDNARGNRDHDLRAPVTNSFPKPAANAGYSGWNNDLPENLLRVSENTSYYYNPVYFVPPVVNNVVNIPTSRSSTSCAYQLEPIPHTEEATSSYEKKLNKATMDRMEKELSNVNDKLLNAKLLQLEEMQLTDSNDIAQQKKLIEIINIRIKQREPDISKYLQNTSGIYTKQVHHSNTPKNNEHQFNSKAKSEQPKSKFNNEKSPSVNLSTTSSVDNTITPNNAEESVKDEQTQSQDMQATTEIDKGPINPPDTKMENTEPDSKKSELEKYKFGTDKNTNFPGSPSTDNEILPTTMEKTENIVDQDNKLKEDTLLATLLSIEEEVQTEYAPKIETFEGEYGNEQFYYLDEGLLTHLESLDRLQLKEYPDLRNRRKELFRYINGLLADLDKKAVKND